MSISVRPAWAWSEAVGRGAVLGAVAFFHLLVLALVMAPATYRETFSDGTQTIRHALRLHLVAKEAMRRERQPVRSSGPASAKKHHPLAVRKDRAPATPADRSMTTARAPAISTPASLSPPPRKPGDDEAGGADFRDRLGKAQRASPVVRLPGSDVPLVAGLTMVDPKMQGVGGVVRGLQRLFGVVDKHCIDVDVWRNMTPQQLIERHISPSDVDRVAEENGCN